MNPHLRIRNIGPVRPMERQPGRGTLSDNQFHPIEPPKIHCQIINDSESKSCPER